MAWRSLAASSAISRLLRHVTDPGAVLIAHGQLARADRREPLAILAVAAGVTLEADPIGGLSEEPFLDAVVGLVIVGHDDRAWRVHDIRVDERVLVELVRGTDEAEAVD